MKLIKGLRRCNLAEVISKAIIEAEPKQVWSIFRNEI